MFYIYEIHTLVGFGRVNNILRQTSFVLLNGIKAPKTNVYRLIFMYPVYFPSPFVSAIASSSFVSTISTPTSSSRLYFLIMLSLSNSPKIIFWCGKLNWSLSFVPNIIQVMWDYTGGTTNDTECFSSTKASRV